MKKEQHQKHNKQQQQQDGDQRRPSWTNWCRRSGSARGRPGGAIEFLRPLQLLSQKRIETHLLAFEIYYRRRSRC